MSLCCKQGWPMKNNEGRKGKQGRGSGTAVRETSLLPQRDASSEGVGSGAELRQGRKTLAWVQFSRNQVRQGGRWSTVLSITPWLKQVLSSGVTAPEILGHIELSLSTNHSYVYMFCYSSAVLLFCIQFHCFLLAGMSIGRPFFLRRCEDERSPISQIHSFIYSFSHWMSTCWAFAAYTDFQASQPLGCALEREAFSLFVSGFSSITFLLSPSSSLANISSLPLHSRPCFRRLQYNSDQNTSLCEFPRATVTEAGWLKMEIYSLTGLEAEKPKIKASAMPCFPQRLWGGKARIGPCLFLISVACQQSVLFLDLWIYPPSVCLCHHRAFSLCLFKSSFLCVCLCVSFLLLRIPVELN